MTTTINNPQTPQPPKQGTVRVTGTIMTEPKEMVSKMANRLLRFSILVDGQTGRDSEKTWWQATVMGKLADVFAGWADKKGDPFFSKFRYAKFTGLGTANKPWSNGDRSGVSNEILVTGIELQDGTYVKTEKSENEDEPAPF